MTTANPTPTITIPVDLTNPGQFFACCGLLELASRLDAEAVGWFTDDAYHLCGEVDDAVRDFLCAAITSCATDTQAELDEEDKKSAFWVGSPFDLRLDWWREGSDNPDTGAVDAKLKTWSAGQKVSDLFECRIELSKPKRGKPKRKVTGVRGWMRVVFEEYPDDWLGAALPIAKPKSFCFDSRLSRNNALDQGHTSGGVMAFAPAVDVLAIIGIQRFRSRTLEVWHRNLFWPWQIPLPVSVAPAAALGYMPGVCHPPMEFPVIPRDAAGKYKLIGHAQPCWSHND